MSGETILPAPQVAITVDLLENIVKAFCKVKNLETAQVETYRWDKPSITATWRGADGINRSMGLLVQDDGWAVAFEVNAWLDNEANLKRKWLNKDFGRARLEKYNVAEASVVVALILEDMFNRVSGVAEGDLIKTDELRPLPQGGKTQTA